MPEFIESLYDLEIKKHSDLEVVLLGYEDCIPGHSYGPVMRPYHIVHFITGGKGCLHIGGRDFELGNGDVFYLPEDEIAYYHASPTDPWKYAWFAFTGTRAAAFQYQFFSISPEKYILHHMDTDMFADIIKKSSSLKDTNTASYYYANSILLELFSRLSGQIPAMMPHISQLTERVKFLLDLKYAEKLQIQEIARDVGVHPNYLSQIFHAAYGVSPKQYVMKLKLSKASQMLVSTDLAVADIAASLGFDDQLSFSRYFRKHQGCSPTEYRKRSRNKDS